MAANNHRSAAVHPDPPPPPSASAPPSLLFMTLVVVLTTISIPIFCIFVIEPGYYPDFQITSISPTRLSSTTPSTWNITLKISNPNLVWTNAYEEVHLSVFYLGEPYDYEAQMIAETGLGPLVQKRGAHEIFNCNLNISRNDLGNFGFERMMRGQKKGFIRFEIRVTFGDETDMKRVLCTDLGIVFNNTGSGFSSDFPKYCFPVDRYYY